MFPHEYDRYRVMGFLLRQARESKKIKGIDGKRKKLTQAGLAERVSERSRIGGISQSTISNLESFDSLDRLFEEETKPGTRARLIEVATLGLRLPQAEVNTLLWLFGGDGFKPLDEAEVGYCQDYEPAARAGVGFGEDEFRRRVLSLVDRWLSKRNAKSPRRVEARMITEWDETGQLEFREELLETERGPGQRMMFGKYPSLLTFPRSLRGQGAEADDRSLSDGGRERAAEITDERRKIFLEHLELYGERCIHSAASIGRYLSRDFQHRLGWDRRREQVENLINLLGRHEHYEVALAEVEPDTEVEIKSTVAACLRATENDTYYWHDRPIICGPLYVYWYDVTTVFSFYRQFERAWDSIPDERRDKNFVIRFLRQTLDAA